MPSLTSPSLDSALRDRAFLQVLGGRLTATLATQSQSVVVGLQLYAMTRDPLGVVRCEYWRGSAARRVAQAVAGPTVKRRNTADGRPRWRPK